MNKAQLTVTANNQSMTYGGSTLPTLTDTISGLANGDTAGQKWTRLRLVNFDGQTPTRAQRFYRTASGFLSLMAGGIGLLWGLVDEETLTWHDHISKTFPTPVN